MRQCLSWKSEPAVIIVVNRSKGGNTMQEQMGAIGKNYDVPVLSMDIALTKAFASGLLTTDDYFEDEFHPHDAGNKLISDAIAYYYRQALKTVNRDESYRMASYICLWNGICDSNSCTAVGACRCGKWFLCIQ